MKKIATLLLAAGLVFGVATGASAIDFKAKGQWIMNFDYGQNGGFTGGNGQTGFNQANKQYKNEDEFEASQRVRLQLDAVASEALSGTVFFEMGDQTWGNNASGGALGADGPDCRRTADACQGEQVVAAGVDQARAPALPGERGLGRDGIGEGGG